MTVDGNGTGTATREPFPFFLQGVSMKRLNLAALIRTEATFQEFQRRLRLEGKADHPFLKLTFEQWRQAQMLDELRPPEKKN